MNGITWTMSKYNIEYIRGSIHILNVLKFWMEITFPSDTLKVLINCCFKLLDFSTRVGDWQNVSHDKLHNSPSNKWPKLLEWPIFKTQQKNSLITKLHIYPWKFSNIPNWKGITDNASSD